MFLNAGRNLLSDDMYYQQEEMRQLSVFLNERICQMKKEYTGKKKLSLFFVFVWEHWQYLTFLKAMYSGSHFFL